MGRLALSKGRGAPISGASVALTGFGATASPGAMTAVVAANSIALTGQQATAEKGSLTVSGGVPASVSVPVVGTDLTSIWNKQTSGTGPQNSPSNGTWSGTIDAYLTGIGFTMGGGGVPFINAGTGTVNVSRYDFTGCPGIRVGGTTGTVNFTDCVYDMSAGDGIISPVDSNGNYNFTNTLTVNHINCWFNYAVTFFGSGTTTHTNCKFSNQPNILGGSGVSPGPTHLVFDGCYIPGGGCAPTSHTELAQQIPTVPTGSTFVCKNCMIDQAANGQATLPWWGSAWTATWSIQTETIEFTNNIIIGIIACNTNTNNSAIPNVIPYILVYASGCTATFTNNCFEDPGASGGYGGYTNGAGTGVDGGGNRNFTNNTAITAF